MANDVILNLKVEGAQQYIQSLAQSAKETESLGSSVKVTESELNDMGKALTNAVKSGSGVSEAYLKLTKSLKEAGENTDYFKSRIKDLKKDLKESEKTLKDLEKQLEKSVGKKRMEIGDQIKELKQGIKDTELAIDNMSASQKAMEQSGKPLSVQFRNMRRELERMAQAGLQNTLAYKELEKKTAELKTTMDEARKSLKSTASATQTLDTAIRTLQAGTAVFGALQGSMALLGGESENLNKALVKLNAIIAINSSLQQVQNELVRQDSIFKKASTVATNLYSRAIGTSTGAMKAFKIAMLSLGLPALLLAIGAIVANWSEWTEKIKSSTTMFDVLREKFGGVVHAIQQFLKGNLNVVESYKEGVKLTKEQITLDRQRTGLGKSIEAVERAILIARRDGASQSKILALQIQKANFELLQMDKNSNEYLEKQIEINALEKKRNDLLKDNVKTIQDTNKELDYQIGSLKDLQSQYNKLMDVVNKTVPYTEEWNKALQEASDISLEIEERQGNINKKLNESKEIYNDWVKLFEGMSETDVNDFDMSDFAKWAMLNLENEERLKEAQGLTFQDKLNKLEALEKAEITHAKSIGANVKYITDFYHIKKLELIEAERQANEDLHKEKMQQMTAEIQQMAGLANQGFSIYKSFQNAQLQVLQNRLNQGLINEEEYQREVAEINRKQAISDKMQAIFNATINTAVAVTKALITSRVLAGIIGALGALQVAAIAKTPIPKFFKGVVGLKRGDNPKGRDTIPAMLNEGESVITTDATKKHRHALETLNAGTFEKYYMKRIDFMKPNLTSLINVATKADNKELRNELRYMNRQLENINSNTHFGANSSSQINRYLRKQKRRYDSRYFV